MSHIAGASAVIAHQGGWDEILLVGAPILVIIVLLAIARRRVDSHVHEPVGAHPADAGTDTGHDTGLDTGLDTGSTDD